MINKIEKILIELEKLEKNWVLNDVEFIHSFGRVPGESEIRLWQIPKSTGEFLNILVKLIKPKNILEIGTSAGYSSIWLASAAEKYGGTINSIEIFEPKIKLAKKYIEKSNLKNINILIGDALQITKNYPKPIDMLFLDADKENYLKYFKNLQKSFKRGTVIIADNAGNYGFLMKDYLDFLKKSKKTENLFLEIDNGLMITKIL